MKTRTVVHLAPAPATAWVLRVGCLALGIGLGFVGVPVARWAVDTLPGVPGPVALAAESSTLWLVPILAIAGLVAGLYVAEEARKESLELTVSTEGLTLTQNSREKFVDRSRIAGAFADGSMLILVDDRTVEHGRWKLEGLSADRVETALTENGYSWLGDHDPYRAGLTAWTDGDPSLPAESHSLLRRRRAARAEKRPDDAEALRADLAELGVVVVDRGDRQWCRSIAPGS